MKNCKSSVKKRLPLIFVLLNLVINVVSWGILWLLGSVLYLLGAFSSAKGSPVNIILLILIFTGSHLLSCFIIALLSRNKVLEPANRLIDGMDELARGNFDVKIDLGKSKGGDNVSKSFNRLAEELSKTEMFRSDFVNNFSHEFKTPIVSILGFSRLLKKGCISEEEKREYLDIIEEESLRLSQMATNVLDMAKVENQAILTGASRYNLSEQIRSCLVLLEKRWSDKNIELCIDFGEFEIEADEEMLKQVWINLLDNAIKFTPEYGEIEISIEKNGENLKVDIANTGEKISDEDIERIFGKFYQADTSHSSKGTGLGLAIAKRIVELHGGKISVVSHESKTVFTVEI